LLVVGLTGVVIAFFSIKVSLTVSPGAAGPFVVSVEWLVSTVIVPNDVVEGALFCGCLDAPQIMFALPIRNDFSTSRPGSARLWSKQRCPFDSEVA
jgi:hypothetical protein